MPATQPATHTPCTPCLQMRKEPRSALAVKAPKKKIEKKSKPHRGLEKAKRSLEYAFNEQDLAKDAGEKV